MSRPPPSVKQLFVDASCLRQRAIAAWGAMLIDGMTSVVRGGVIGVALSASTVAEINGVRYALRSLLRSGDIVPGDTIVIHCDNREVCDAIQIGRMKPLNPKHPFDVQLIRIKETAAEFRLSLCARWIRGHGSPDSDQWRSLINQRVDREAQAIARAEHERRVANGDIGRVPKARWIIDDSEERIEA